MTRDFDLVLEDAALESHMRGKLAALLIRDSSGEVICELPSLSREQVAKLRASCEEFLRLRPDYVPRQIEWKKKP